MKEKWERVNPAVPLKEAEIEARLQSFLPGKKLVSAQLMGGGFSNSNYKLYIDSFDQPLVLRVSKQDTCKMETSLHESLHKRLPVPKIFYSDCEGDISFSFMEWEEGIQLKDLLYANDREQISSAAYSAGFWLSEIRKNTFTQAGMFNEKLEVSTPLEITPDTFLEFMEGFLLDGQTGNWLGKELTAKLWNFSRTNSIFLRDIDSKPALVHSDYNGLNLLVSDSEQPKVTGILDWEFAFAGPVFVDIGNMLRYDDFIYFTEFEQAFVKGMQYGGVKLPSEWKKISKLNDLIALCDLLNKQNGGKNKVNDIKRLIVKMMDDWDTL